MPDKLPPLPVAADHAAISNRLSMLFSARSSLVKKLVPPSSTPRNTSRHARPAEDEDILFGRPANQGVGYVSDKPDTKPQDKMLRGKLLGRRKVGGGESRSKVVESESDEEEGRGSLGKRKRPRKERGRACEVGDGDEHVEAVDADKDRGTGHGAEGYAVTEPQEKESQVQATSTSKRRKKAKKKKNKGKGKVEGGMD
ncbi:hypothetical protein VFPPC_12979 [Pochonia chlamydosporia 170]|uniref:Uncharacterized protein n=1 Tax=Pochonia chlamydosporia 170 TaxID=1380566 RepID=A0A179G658_METCM|nr:hypothetical protein VFPPC_12979 [Pochonia chlamydosporia 170]OAQ73314.1 hypothetical protein VFPPC_12979 [Pochonia chlamydosporia 170]